MEGITQEIYPTKFFIIGFLDLKQKTEQPKPRETVKFAKEAVLLALVEQRKVGTRFDPLKAIFIFFSKSNEFQNRWTTSRRWRFRPKISGQILTKCWSNLRLIYWSLRAIKSRNKRIKSSFSLRLLEKNNLVSGEEKLLMPPLLWSNCSFGATRVRCSRYLIIHQMLNPWQRQQPASESIQNELIFVMERKKVEVSLSLFFLFFGGKMSVRVGCYGEKCSNRAKNYHGRVSVGNWVLEILDPVLDFWF